MINDTVEEEITPELIRQRVKKYTGLDHRITEGAIHLMMEFLDADEDDRESFLQNIRAFVCHECGKPSCLHGYSDE